LGIVNAHFVSFRAERSGVEKSCSFDAAQDRFNRSLYNPAFGRDDNGASFNHNWYDIAISFYCIDKILRGFFIPAFKRCLLGQLVKCVVNFNGVEMLAIVFKPPVFWQLFRIKQSRPVVIMPPGCADSNFRLTPAHNFILICWKY